MTCNYRAAFTVALAVFFRGRGGEGGLLSFCVQQTAGVLKSEPSGAVRADRRQRDRKSCSKRDDNVSSVAGFEEMMEDVGERLHKMLL